MPAISVIVPTRNRNHLLPRSLGSLLSQTFQDIEILVVDDNPVEKRIRKDSALESLLANSKIRVLEHGISEAQADDGFKRILNNAFLCTPDGMPLVWVGWLKGRKEMDRVYGPDLMLNLLALSEKSGYRHFFYGGADGTVNTLREKLQKRFPRLQICGVYEPPFRPLTPSEFTDLQRQLEVAKPDVMWVGLSTPKQEKFMMSNTNDPVNIGNPSELTILEFAQEIIAATGARSKIVYKPLPQDDPRQRQPDITRARKLLKWEPKVNLKEGLAKTIEYFKKKV